MEEQKKSGVLKTIAVIFGVIFIVIGILGFVPDALKDGNLLFGLFKVNTAHNIIHIVTGVIGVFCGLSCWHASRLFFQVFGVIYGIITLLGLYYQNNDMFNGLIAHNVHDIWLHAIVAAFALYLGFFCHCNRCCSADNYCKKNDNDLKK